MSTRTVAAPIAAILAALALPTPAASASHATANCRFNAVSQATATGPDVWEGHAQGYVVAGSGEAVAIRCVVRVDGAIRASTGWGTGSTVAVTAGRVTYVRALTDFTQLCAEYATAHGPGETCVPTTTTQIPPFEEVDNALRELGELLPTWDEGLCPTFTTLTGTYGPVVIKPGSGGGGSDVYVNGELFWDCPTYEPYEPAS